MEPRQYARLVGHSEGYVRKYMMHGADSDRIVLRIRTIDVMEDIWDVREKKPD